MLYNFSGTSGGSFPTSALALDRQDNLYGTTMSGGNLKCNAAYGCRTVFKLDMHGNLTVLHSFSGGRNGATPLHGRLVRDAKGTLYGTTAGGGTAGAGTIFALD